MRSIIFDNYKTMTHIDMSDFWKLFWKTLQNRPSYIFSMYKNNVKKLWYKVRYGKKIDFGKNNYFIGKYYIDILENEKECRLKFGNGCLIKNEHVKNHFELQHGGKVTIGNNVFLNGVFIYSFKGVDIGDDVTIGWGTDILDTDAHPIDKNTPLRSKKVKIGNRVWIAKNSTILKGVTIGEGSVIGSRSVVTRDVKPHSLYAGNPAKFVKKIAER